MNKLENKTTEMIQNKTMREKVNRKSEQNINSQPTSSSKIY